MGERNPLSIRSCILLLIVVLTIVPSVFIAYSVLQQRTSDFSAATRLAEGLSNEVSSEQNVLLSGAEQLLSCLAFISCVQNRDAKATTPLLVDLVKKNPEISNIALADATGLVWASALPLRVATMVNDRRYFSNVMATGNFSSGEFTVERARRKPALSFGYPIKDSFGKVLDVAIIVFDMTKYNQLLKMKKLPDFTSLVLTDHKGTILYDATRPDLIGRQDKAEIFKRMLQGPDKGAFEAAGNPDDDRFFAYQKLHLDKEQTPYMYVRSGLLKETVARKTRDDLMVHAGLFITITSLALGFAIYFSKRNVVDKIDALRDATKRVARGDLDIHVSGYVSGGELGELAISFDAMAHRLADDITERERSEVELREYLLFIETLLENAPAGIRVFDGESGKCLLANRVSSNIAGADMKNLQRQNFRELASWLTSGLLEVAEEVLADGFTREVETDMLTSFGKEVSVAYIVSSLVVKEKAHLIIIGRDITVEKQLLGKNKRIEAQLLHVQKLESLGVLAGGIAHDFNNILLAILGNAELALMELPPESLARDNLQNIGKAGQRAADLARQMLAYSGKGRFVIERLDINALITEMNHILGVSISKKAALRLSLAEDLPFFEGDATQLRQIIMNLIINASEAIGDLSGVIDITTVSIDCDQAYLSQLWMYDKLEEGPYICLEITDSGCGMDRETLAKIFDPFFTTKFTGRGLGMAAVLGIVRGHRGAITVYSEPGKGTSFKVFLPASPDACARSPQKSTPVRPAMGSGTILLVDDEEMILMLGKEMLERLGYRVLTANNGVVALEIFQAHKETILCVILDLTMPLLDGAQTFRELQSIDQNVRVIISSGFNEHELAGKFVVDGLAGFIHKPYRLVELSRKLQEATGVGGARAVPVSSGRTPGGDDGGVEIHDTRSHAICAVR